MDIKRIVKAGCRYLLDSDYRFLFNSYRNAYDKMPDEKYLRRLFKAHLGRELDLQNPQAFNDKLQWLKLYNRRPEYTMMVDKVAVRKYIAEKVGEEYLIPSIGVWENPDQIDFDALPDRFVLKCNHNSGLGMCICKDKSRLNIEKVREDLRRGLQEDYYLTTREWPYKNVPRRILGEQFMSDGTGKDLTDYKFMCFNGKVKSVIACTERSKGEDMKVTFLDRDWNQLPFGIDYATSKVPIPKPQNYEKMILLSEQLAAEHPFIRIDLYECAGRIYFGELTFFTSSGLDPIHPEEWDYTLGSWLTLPPKYNS